MAGSVLITGANGSLAINAVEYLLRAFPELTLLLTVRDESDDDPNTTQLRHLIAKHPEASISVLKLDLNSLKEVAGFCDQVAAEIISSRVPRLVAIICNEVHWRLSGGPNKSDDGFEQSMAINHLAHFALSVRLLCSRSLDLVNGRIVFLGSQAHWLEKAGLSKGFPTKLPEDLEDLVHPPPDSWSAELGRGFQRYAQSKLVITMVMYELNRTLKKSKATELIQAVTVDPLNFTTSVGRAAKVVVDIAVSEEFAGSEGYFEGRQKVASSPDSLDENVQRELWVRSLRWCKLKEDDAFGAF